MIKQMDIHMKLQMNKTWSSVSNSSLSKTFVLCQFRKQTLCFLPPNIVLGLKKMNPKILLGEKKILVQKKIWVQKNLGLEKFGLEKNFGPEKILNLKKILGPKTRTKTTKISTIIDMIRTKEGSHAKFLEGQNLQL